MGIIYVSKNRPAETPIQLSVWELPVWFAIGILWGAIGTLLLVNTGVI